MERMRTVSNRTFRKRRGWGSTTIADAEFAADLLGPPSLFELVSSTLTILLKPVIRMPQLVMRIILVRDRADRTPFSVMFGYAL